MGDFSIGLHFLSACVLNAGSQRARPGFKQSSINTDCEIFFEIKCSLSFFFVGMAADESIFLFTVPYLVKKFKYHIVIIFKKRNKLRNIVCPANKLEEPFLPSCFQRLLFQHNWDSYSRTDLKSHLCCKITGSQAQVTWKVSFIQLRSTIISLQNNDPNTPCTESFLIRLLSQNERKYPHVEDIG